MINNVRILISAVLISASILYTGSVTNNYLSAGDKKAEISVQGTASPEAKIESARISQESSIGKTDQDEQILYKVALIILVIWTGISFFLIHIERKLKKIETALKE